MAQPTATFRIRITNTLTGEERDSRSAGEFQNAQWGAKRCAKLNTRCPHLHARVVTLWDGHRN